MFLQKREESKAIQFRELSCFRHIIICVFLVEHLQLRRLLYSQPPLLPKLHFPNETQAPHSKST
jgi:hypothetical protein